MSKSHYCIDIFNYTRYHTSEVQIGNLRLGAKHPIVVQSMTTTNTNDTEATVHQIKNIFDAGGQMVRMTTQGQREAGNLKAIKEELKQQGYDGPLVADIHFNPNAANIAAQHIEKVRINPGNFVDGAKKFESIEYTNESYYEELELIKRKLIPLLNICKQNNTAIRIGTNHGSLSDRIMSRYGDTPLGMVESCMEFLRICRDEEFGNVVLSIKASNARIMVHTVRLLVQKMHEEDMYYPLHLGVTEAGEGEDGRIRSAVGIGTLLADGIGDTIRVSLTEAPENEISVAKDLIAYVEQRANHEVIEAVSDASYYPFKYVERASNVVRNVGGHHVPVVVGNMFTKNDRPDYVFSTKKRGEGSRIVALEQWRECDNKDRCFPLLEAYQIEELDKLDVELALLRVFYADLTSEVLKKLRGYQNVVLVLKAKHTNSVAEQRAAFLLLGAEKVTCPVIIYKKYEGLFNNLTQLNAACDFGPLFLDGFGDGIWIDYDQEMETGLVNKTAYSVLQAARVRFEKPDYISCPGCGRTLFGLQETTALVKAQTAHLKGLKIAVMGCIVNGPGEMADADYGYVGSGPGKITLYHQREVVKANIKEEDAVGELIQLIKQKGDWIDPV
ncbi:(E)-4-hydroxy-3-methylbut-2-enyl-diphosphate synthase [Saccharicrinis fermentans]|uniref:4-hydroxy-3-methylbut-2-en-1-yl diphosphate synthase (flavodoxin) n=1 Tax=Saccharicrinis fermentans DSM 9555 = JCM 21142 TaxID=869213 RepID=W7Y0V9_9BACT|nr:(E)-4-hydroxy-3-methylbut-2-enyl-diphosphate synthase [Saccharicrinis fermentans]GAF01577.1 4-hydroxy-3-methylbut-2-en-1-yl diphosphate synthase [Saccharicrinis fermentans DSM 9555 = JCM 21142]